MRKAVLILTRECDLHSDAVITELQRRNVPVVRFNTARFPTGVRLALHVSPEEVDGEINILDSGLSIRLEDIGSVWFRRPELPEIPTGDQVDPSVRTWLVNECWEAIRALARCLHHATWVNPPDAERAAEAKVRQLLIARQLGLSIPPSLVTNQPAAAKQFYNRWSGEVVVKPLFFSLLGRPLDPQAITLFTSKIDAAATEHFDELTDSVAFLQHYIPKAFEVRVTVYGDRAFAASIDSQSCERTKIDWRRGSIDDCLIRPHALPSDVADKCVETLRMLGLRFGAFDFVVTPAGEYVFLEVNPNGQWLWVAEATGLPMVPAMADLLCDGS